MEQSTSISSLAKAMLAARKKYRKLKRNRVNPHFKARYADLDACYDATLPALTEAGLVVVQGASMAGNQVAVTTEIIHAESGEWIRETTLLPLGGQANPQAAGAAITYARRYGFSAITGITPDDDDDAEVAMQRPTGTAATAPRTLGQAAQVRPAAPTGAATSSQARPPTHQ